MSGTATLLRIKGAAEWHGNSCSTPPVGAQPKHPKACCSYPENYQPHDRLEPSKLTAITAAECQIGCCLTGGITDTVNSLTKDPRKSLPAISCILQGCAPPGLTYPLSTEVRGTGGDMSPTCTHHPPHSSLPVARMQRADTNAEGTNVAPPNRLPLAAHGKDAECSQLSLQDLGKMAQELAQDKKHRGLLNTDEEECCQPTLRLKAELELPRTRAAATTAAEHCHHPIPWLKVKLDLPMLGEPAVAARTIVTTTWHSHTGAGVAQVTNTATNTAIVQWHSHTNGCCRCPTAAAVTHPQRCTTAPYSKLPPVTDREAQNCCHPTFWLNGEAELKSNYRPDAVPLPGHYYLIHICYFCTGSGADGTGAEIPDTELLWRKPPATTATKQLDLLLLGVPADVTANNADATWLKLKLLRRRATTIYMLSDHLPDHLQREATNTHISHAHTGHGCTPTGTLHMILLDAQEAADTSPYCKPSCKLQESQLTEVLATAPTNWRIGTAEWHSHLQPTSAHTTIYMEINHLADASLPYYPTSTACTLPEHSKLDAKEAPDYTPKATPSSRNTGTPKWHTKTCCSCPLAANIQDQFMPSKQEITAAAHQHSPTGAHLSRSADNLSTCPGTQTHQSGTTTLTHICLCYLFSTGSGRTTCMLSAPQTKQTAQNKRQSPHWPNTHLLLPICCPSAARANAAEFYYR